MAVVVLLSTMSVFFSCQSFANANAVMWPQMSRRQEVHGHGDDDDDDDDDHRDDSGEVVTLSMNCSNY